MLSRIFARCAAISLITASLSIAQDTRGLITGRVFNPTGAVVARATVVVRNNAMGTKVTIQTAYDGIYRAALLSPGLYEIEVASAGFKKVIRRDLEVRVADRLDINFTMEIGASEQQVTVVAETPLLNTESASAGTVVDAKRVAELPLCYGNPFLLIGLTAGVTFNGSVRLDRPFEPTHIVNFSMGGTRQLERHHHRRRANNSHRQRQRSDRPLCSADRYRAEIQGANQHVRCAVGPNPGWRHQHQHQKRHQQLSRQYQLLVPAPQLLGQ